MYRYVLRHIKAIFLLYHTDTDFPKHKSINPVAGILGDRVKNELRTPPREDRAALGGVRVSSLQVMWGRECAECTNWNADYRSAIL